jgi:glutamine---fructose-6-phosphate transaminase (isomerizing)
MCGIVGVLSNNNIIDKLINGLKRLEYRGYDSAGIAVINDNAISCRHATGKITVLDNVINNNPVSANIGIAHTRWATHGRPTIENAHPITTDKVAVVHNGIIENFRILKQELIDLGVKFKTETDTEVVTQLIDYRLKQGDSEIEAIKNVMPRLEGAFALGIIFASKDDVIYCARHGAPLVIGLNEGEKFIGSDAYALAPFTNQVCYLEDGDYAEISLDNCKIYDKNNLLIERNITQTNISGAMIGKGNYRHFMLKEIYEQPICLAEVLGAYLNINDYEINLPIDLNLTKIKAVTIIACGTSYYAAMVARYWIEELVQIPVIVDIASEYRYRKQLITDDNLLLFISQSGETADIVAAIKLAKQYNQNTVAIVNVPESSLARLANYVIPILAGPEIGVASTKAFTSQLMVFALFALYMAQKTGSVNNQVIMDYCNMLSEVPGRISNIFNVIEENITVIAKELSGDVNAIYIGRGTNYPIALEGALKLKELSYIHAEGIAAGELKHGPIALIDEYMPIIALAPNDRLFEKTSSSIQEIHARGGKIITIGSYSKLDEIKEYSKYMILLPESDEFINPILYAVPMQLLSYHTAAIKGLDVDQPRNLAKSVTVE